MNTPYTARDWLILGRRMQYIAQTMVKASTDTENRTKRGIPVRSDALHALRKAKRWADRARSLCEDLYLETVAPHESPEQLHVFYRDDDGISASVDLLIAERVDTIIAEGRTP